MEATAMAVKIVVVGSFNTDLTAYVKRIPRPGETVAGERFVVGPGGKGSNQAVAAARLGAEVTFIGRVGKDMFAPIALGLWEREGIDTSYVVQDANRATGCAPILVDESGENYIVVALGANLALCRADVDVALGVMRQADVMLTQLEIKHETSYHAMRLARENGVTTILNPAPAAAISSDFLALADYVTPNETDLDTLSHGPHSSILEAGASLIGRPGQTVIVTLGEKGACYIQDLGGQIVPGFKVDVVDTTGAGDAFNGGLAVALGEKRDLPEAIRFANATAALSVTKPGAAPSMPHRKEVEEFLLRDSGGLPDKE